MWVKKNQFDMVVFYIFYFANIIINIYISLCFLLIIKCRYELRLLYQITHIFEKYKMPLSLEIKTIYATLSNVKKYTFPNSIANSVFSSSFIVIATVVSHCFLFVRTKFVPNLSWGRLFSLGYLFFLQWISILISPEQFSHILWWT